jgi:hypothetical protein
MQKLNDASLASWAPQTPNRLHPLPPFIVREVAHTIPGQGLCPARSLPGMYMVLNCQDRQTRRVLLMVTRSLSARRLNNVGEPGPHHADWPPNGTVQGVGGAVWHFGA